MISLSGSSIIMTTDETLTCRTYNGATLGNGIEIVGGKRIYKTAETFSFYCNVQPVSGRDLIMVPEGDRFDEQLFLYVPNEQGRVPDINDLVYRENWYQVQDNEYWQSYSRLRISRVDVGPDRALSV